MFVLDASGSINSSNFEIMKNFVVNVTRSLESTPDSKVGVIRFSGSAEVIIPLAANQNLSDLATQVQAIRYTGGGTATHEALELMITELLAANDSAAPIGILLTDGRSNYEGLTLAEAARVHKEGISMYTFGIGNTNEEELQAIASAPFYDYSFYISSFDATQFDQRVLLLTRQTCSSEFSCSYMYAIIFAFVVHGNTTVSIYICSSEFACACML